MDLKHFLDFPNQLRSSCEFHIFLRQIRSNDDPKQYHRLISFDWNLEVRYPIDSLGKVASD